MPLTPDEEKKLREEIRKKLEGREQKEREHKQRAESEKSRLLEERMRAKIKEEETEKYYSEKGYVKYKNRHGETEWLLPEEAEKRQSRRRSTGRSKQSRKAKARRNLYINLAIVIVVTAVFAVVYKYNPGNKVQTGNLFVDSNISGAIIYLDGKRLNHFTPDTLRQLKTGDHLINVYKEGYSAFPPVKPVTLAKNKTTVVRFELQNTARLATVQLHVNLSGFQLYVDGLPYAVETDGMAQVPHGYHTFMVVKPGYVGDPSYRRILVKPDKVAHLHFELVRDSDIGLLQVSNNLFAGNVYLDKYFTGFKARGDVIPVRPGIYEVRVLGNGYCSQPDSQLVNIVPGQKRLLVFRMEREEKSMKINIRSKKPGAAIFIDGEWTPYVTPVTGMEISPGRHFINLARDSELLSSLDVPIYVKSRSRTDFYYDF